MGSAQSTVTNTSSERTSRAEQSLLEKQQCLTEMAASTQMATDRLAKLHLGGSESAELTEADLDIWGKQYESEPMRKTLGTLLRYEYGPDMNYGRTIKLCVCHSTFLVVYSKQDILANLTNRAAEVADTQVFNVKLSVEVTRRFTFPLTTGLSCKESNESQF